MKLTAKVKLVPTPQQRGVLLETMRCFNAACNYIAGVGWETRTFKQVPLHHQVYYTVKDRFGLSAQMAVRANAKVVDAYKLDKQAKRSFRELGAITYDDRVLSRLRRKLQKKGTKGAKRRLKKLSGKERRFAHDVNHTSPSASRGWP